MIKPASSLCNLRCKYCFYANVSDLREVKSFGVMKKEVYTKVTENIFKDLEAGDNLTIAFQGGEPTVAGIEFFEGFIKEVDRVNKGVKVSYALQTNATLIDEKWANLFKNIISLLVYHLMAIKKQMIQTGLTLMEVVHMKLSLRLYLCLMKLVLNITF